MAVKPSSGSLSSGKEALAQLGEAVISDKMNEPTEEFEQAAKGSDGGTFVFEFPVSYFSLEPVIVQLIKSVEFQPGYARCAI